MVLNHCGPTFQSLQKYFLASKRMLEHVLAWSKTCKYHSEQLVLLLRPLTLQKYYALFKTIVSWNNNDVCIQIQQRCRVIFLYVQSCTWEINKSLFKLNWIKKNVERCIGTCTDWVKIRLKNWQPNQTKSTWNELFAYFWSEF